MDVQVHVAIGRSREALAAVRTEPHRLRPAIAVLLALERLAGEIPRPSLPEPVDRHMRAALRIRRSHGIVGKLWLVGGIVLFVARDDGSVDAPMEVVGPPSPCSQHSFLSVVVVSGLPP